MYATRERLLAVGVTAAMVGALLSRRRVAQGLLALSRLASSAAASPTAPLSGCLYRYKHPSWPAPLQAFESPAAHAHRKYCVYIGGLTDGLLACSYVEALGAALDERGWSLVQPVLSSSYAGFGCSSLQRDADELAPLRHTHIHTLTTAAVNLSSTTSAYARVSRRSSCGTSPTAKRATQSLHSSAQLLSQPAVAPRCRTAPLHTFAAVNRPLYRLPGRRHAAADGAARAALQEREGSMSRSRQLFRYGRSCDAVSTVGSYLTSHIRRPSCAVQGPCGGAAN